ncbi:hypothetical protein ACLOJK_005216 [Asimina triloba]
MEQEESQEMRISLLHSSIDDDAPPPPHTSLIAYLYAGHFLGRWGARMWEFSFGLFMIDVWPDSQLFAAIYGAVESASTALFGSVIGQWVDRFTYFKVLRAWLLAQNLSFIVAGGTVTTLLIYHALKSSGFIAFMSLVVLTNVSGATGVLATLAGTILIEREWVVVISSGQPPETLTKMNSVIRRYVSVWMLMGGVAASRLGLWMFDLAVIQQMQDHVPETDRCVVGGVQNSLQAMLDLMTYILGMFISDPKDFGTLEMVSFILVTLSALLYSLHVYKVRKHLFHFDKLFLKISTLIQQL